MDNKRKKRSKGMGLCGGLVTLFIILKITDVISWSWLWVFSPIWITLIICIVAFGLILVEGRIKKENGNQILKKNGNFTVCKRPLTCGKYRCQFTLIAKIRPFD